MQEDRAVVRELCRCMHEILQELEAETAERMRLQSELGAVLAAQQQQNAALGKLKLALSAGARQCDL
jgi:hypothetical protein